MTNFQKTVSRFQPCSAAGGSARTANEMSGADAQAGGVGFARPMIVALASALVPFESYIRSCPPHLRDKGLLDILYGKWPRTTVLQEVARQEIGLATHYLLLTTKQAESPICMKKKKSVKLYEKRAERKKSKKGLVTSEPIAVRGATRCMLYTTC